MGISLEKISELITLINDVIRDLLPEILSWEKRDAGALTADMI